jgi:phi13 family phage major tail protein
MEQGYYYGVLDVYYAKMSQEDTIDTAAKYSAPKVLGKSIEVTITPAYSEGKMYASNVVVRNRKKVETYGVKLNVDKVPYDIQKDILGRETDTAGVQLIKGTNVTPKVAIGFACTLDDGSTELWWLYKGEFAEPTKTAKTDGEKIEYQTPTIEGVFVRRMNDNALAAVADTSNAALGTNVATNWFKNVYGSAA